MPFIILLSLIIFHEIGHFLAALFFKIEVDKIYIYPFGGISKFNMPLNESILKEFIVLIMGPLFQIFYFYILFKIPYLYHYKELISVYHYTILTFNLLPIYPLDGGKLLNLFFHLTISFKRSFNLSILVSYIVVVLLLMIMVDKNISINSIVVISFLLYKINTEKKKKNYLFDKFILERYLNHYQYKKIKKVKNINEFMRGKRHIMKKNGKYYTEKEILYNKFNRKY